VQLHPRPPEEQERATPPRDRNNTLWLSTQQQQQEPNKQQPLQPPTMAPTINRHSSTINGDDLIPFQPSSTMAANPLSSSFVSTQIHPPFFFQTIYLISPLPNSGVS